eukprot:6231164-Pyramimonas_sp.AAC.1
MKGVQRLHHPTCSVPQRTKSRAATTARPIGSLGTPGANSCRGTPDFLRTKVNVMRPSDANIAVKARSTRTPLLHVRCVASAGGDAVVSAPPRGVTYRNLGGNSWKMHMPQSNTTFREYHTSEPNGILRPLNFALQVLCDPWLVGDLTFFGQEWLYAGKKNLTGLGLEAAEGTDILLLSQAICRSPLRVERRSGRPGLLERMGSSYGSWCLMASLCTTNHTAALMPGGISRTMQLPCLTFSLASSSY